MKNRPPLLGPTILALSCAIVLGGCASTQVTGRDAYTGGKLPRPHQIVVYDFAVAPEDIPAWADAHDAYDDAAADVTPQELEAGRKLGADVANELIKKISAMGLTAVHARNEPDPQIDDIVLVGYFESIDKGSVVKRLVIGFGKGSADVKAHVEGFHVTSDGLRRLGSGSVSSGGSKMPGLVVPAIVTIATDNPIGIAVGGAVKAEGELTGRTTDVGASDRMADRIAKELKVEFQRQGWI